MIACSYIKYKLSVIKLEMLFLVLLFIAHFSSVPVLAIIEYHEDVTWELQTSDPPNCQHYPSKAELQGHVDSIYGFEIGEVTSGAPDLSVSESECEQYFEQYKTATGYTHFFTQDSASRPKGCWLYNNVQVYWNYHATGGGSCSGSDQICLQKVVTTKPVPTISDATLPHGALYRPLYVEVTSGSPDGSVTEEECEAYAVNTEGKQWERVDSWTQFLPGCLGFSNGNVYFNTATTAHECGYNNRMCIQKTGGYNVLCHLGNTLQ